MKKKIHVESIVLSTFFMVLLYHIKKYECKILKIVHPHPANKTEIENERIYHAFYDFKPISTIVGISFISICIATLAIVKIAFGTNNQYMVGNKYDLVIYKPPSKNNNNKFSNINNNVSSQPQVNLHNLNAAAAVGFDSILIEYFKNRSITKNTRKMTKK
jgi:hypothetical protein